MASQPSVSFGVLLLPCFQLLDAVGPFDMINSSSKEYVNLLYPPLAPKAVSYTWHYISTSGDLTPISATSGPLLQPTCTIKDCPKLDYLLIPGPDPTGPFPEETLAFIRKVSAEAKEVLTICTGSMVLAAAGVLDGRRACTNKFALKALAAEGKHRKEVKWVTDKRWVVDGKFWTSAGITAGIDMAMEWLKDKTDPDVLQLLLDASEVVVRTADEDPYAHLLDGVKL
ncbi:hypothetical protein BOTBODRAFT_123282 [Botryobasidium botryosum FD-172 SS1]|uniref:DJ-1/PfpI domain-containing protein n=1 Tax=Botryobasidium botryosum (strain FD-172 SS1) TaxID=930990 RepID=A0A067N3G3_BOTB1|nr:hypothetical protein BOTBODRAFT_123282 [Botryobasidium botryosum FD-172 SS1]